MGGLPPTRFLIYKGEIMATLEEVKQKIVDACPDKEKLERALETGGFNAVFAAEVREMWESKYAKPAVAKKSTKVVNTDSSSVKNDPSLRTKDVVTKKVTKSE